MRDLYHNVLAAQVLSPVVSTTTKTSSAIDLQGFSGLSVVFDLGLSADTLSNSLYWTLSLEEGNDNSSWTAVSATECNAGVNSITVNTTSSDRQAYAIGYIGNARYIKALATPTGSVSSGMPIGIVALKGISAYRPVVTP